MSLLVDRKEETHGRQDVALQAPPADAEAATQAQAEKAGGEKTDLIRPNSPWRLSEFGQYLEHSIVPCPFWYAAFILIARLIYVASSGPSPHAGQAGVSSRAQTCVGNIEGLKMALNLSLIVAATRLKAMLAQQDWLIAG